MTSGEALARDLVVLTPDETFRAVVAALLGRPQSLGVGRVSWDLYAHAHHDSGCLRESAGVLAPFLSTHQHALVLFDKHGCGMDEAAPEEIEHEVEGQLQRAGWEGRARAIVLDPELEVWVWSDSPEVDRCLGWSGRQPGLRDWLRGQGLWERSAPKPGDPKLAAQLALREAQRGPLRPVLVDLACSVGLSRCTDRAFLRFRQTLQRWFPTH